ncbi:MAG: enoyl-CoA hydratase-related protein [Hyphomicrobiales bacterium]
MKNFENIIFESNDDIGIIWLNRPDKRNALNEQMISEIIEVLTHKEYLDGLKVLLLRGKGSVFCAGADLNWMKEAANYNYQQNYQESRNLSLCFQSLYDCPIPTIAIVHKAAIGGAVGLLAASDMAFATDDCVFALPELRLGLIPACISPYIIKRIGEYNSKFLMYTGKTFNAQDAITYHLINDVYDSSSIDAKVNEIIQHLLLNGSNAVKHCKALINKVCNVLSHEEAMDYAIKMIAEIRLSEEGQEGMSAFLEKRLPSWIKSKNG